MIATETAPENTAGLVRLIRSARVDLSSEKAAQDDLERLLAQNHVTCEREVRLNDRDIVDFLAGEIAIELKLKGARKKAVFRQLQRYAESPLVNVIILASNLSMGLPYQINGKDAYFVRLGEGWL